MRSMQQIVLRQLFMEVPMPGALSPDFVEKMHAYWRAANYLSVGQVYLKDNPLLDVGIARADLPRVLERFGQIDSMLARKHNGTGLGWQLVKKLVELHGGSLRIASETSVGTTVTALFPLERVIKSTASAAA